MPKNNLSLSEELDFAYLLELMRPLSAEPNYAWLPELFSLIGVESLIQLCKYAGGQTIKLPTLDQLNYSIEAMQWFYEVHIKGVDISNVPKQYVEEVNRIIKLYANID